MRNIRSLITAAALIVGLGPVMAQQFQNVPPNTVIGRLGNGFSGPSQAIPISTLLANFGGQQNPNLVWASPGSGIAQGAPTFRALVGADLPFPSVSSLGGIQSYAAVAHQWINSISTTGVPASSQPACGDLSNAAASCSTDATNASNIATGTLATARLPAPFTNGLSALTNSLGADVLLNNTANYFDGPSIAQGSTGTWWVSGTVTVLDTAAGASIFCKLWDGTSVIASTIVTTGGASFLGTIALSGFITSPAGNLRISCRDGAATTGKIIFNSTGLSKDSTISVVRIQ